MHNSRMYLIFHKTHRSCSGSTLPPVQNPARSNERPTHSWRLVCRFYSVVFEAETCDVAWSSRFPLTQLIGVYHFVQMGL